MTLVGTFATILIGKIGDEQSRKVALMIPFAGLILSDVTLLLQSYFIQVEIRRSSFTLNLDVALLVSFERSYFRFLWRVWINSIWVFCICVQFFENQQTRSIERDGKIGRNNWCRECVGILPDDGPALFWAVKVLQWNAIHEYRAFDLFCNIIRPKRYQTSR